MLFQQLSSLFDRCLFGRQPFPTLVVDQPHFACPRRQPSIGVVLSQQQPEFGSAGEHAIRFIDAARHQIVNHHADIRRFAAERQWFAAGECQRRVGAGNEPLCSRLFVAGRAVDLPGKIEPRHHFGLQ